MKTVFKYILKNNKFSFVILFLIIIGITLNISAQTPCNQRVIGNVDFTFNGAGTAPARWNMSQIKAGGFTIDTTAYTYVPTGNFSNQNLNPSGGTNNATRQYAIVSNPNTLSPQYANIPTDGMIVFNPLQGNSDQYGIFNIAGLVPGKTYNIEIKVWNVINMAMPGACGQWCNWNNQLNLLWEGNANNAQDGQTNMNYTGTNGNGTWNGFGSSQMTNMLKINSGGAYAIITGQVTLAPLTTGFKLTIRKTSGGDPNPVVLGIDYIKVYGCQTEAINVSGGATSICEGTNIMLTAQGIGSATSTYSWYQNGVLLPGRNSDTLNIVSPIGIGTSVIYKAVGDWSNHSDTLIAKMCCSTTGGTSDEIIRQSFDSLTYTCLTGGTPDGSRHGGYADIPDKNVKNFIDPGYTYAGTGCSTLDDAQYAVVQSSYAGNFWQNRPEVKDHTGVLGSGALFVNAIGIVGQVFYKFNLTGLCNNTRYEFSSWYASLAATGEVVPNIEFDVMNGATKVATVSTGTITKNEVWYEASVTFVTPATGNPTYTLQAINLVPGGNHIAGNDLMLDDIVVKKCTPYINLYLTGTKIDTASVSCNVNSVNIKVSTYYDLPLAVTGSSTGTVYYQWMQSASPNGPWILIGKPEKTGSLSAMSSSTTYFRAKVSADSTRASTGLSPLASECGNDGMTSSFKLTKGGNFTIPAITGITSYCQGTAMTLTGNSGTGTEWEWMSGATYASATVISGYSFSSDITKKIFSKTFTQSDATNYYFVVKDANGCEASSTDTIKMNGTPTITAKGDSICGAGTFTLTATPSSGIVNWYSSVSGGTSIGTGSPWTTPSIGSTATYYAEAVDGACVSATRASVIAKVNSIPTITAVGNSRNGTGTVTLTATASSGIINWYSSVSGGTSIGTGSPWTTPSISTTTTYYAEALDGACVSATRASAIATIDSFPTITAFGDRRCGTGTDTLTATASSGTINWYTLITGGTSIGTGSPWTTPSISTTTTYYAEAVDGIHKSITRAPAVAKINTIPIITATGGTAYSGSSVNLTANNGVSYSWNTGSTTNPQNVSPSVTTTYFVTGTDANGCTNTAEAVATIIPKDTVTVPNVFTPNNDGINDYFIIKGIEYGEWQLIVFNRWGRKVYENNHYDNTSNKWGAEGCDEGVYYYILRNATDSKQTKTGYVEVLR